MATVQKSYSHLVRFYPVSCEYKSNFSEIHLKFSTRRNVAVTWFFNGQSLGSGRKLVIENIKKTSEGLYNCSAKVGRRRPKTQTFKITVVGKIVLSYKVSGQI